MDLSSVKNGHINSMQSDLHANNVNLNGQHSNGFAQDVISTKTEVPAFTPKKYVTKKRICVCLKNHRPLSKFNEKCK